MTPRAGCWFASSLGAVLLGLVALNLTAAQPVASGDRISLPGLNYSLVKLPAGVVVMGRGDPNSKSDEAPATRVTLTKPFWVGVTEVTVAQWRHFTEATGYITEAEAVGAGLHLLRDKAGPKRRGLSWRNPGFAQDDTHPVVGISWEDAQQFCRWLTEREKSAGRLPEGYIYTLPTEAQWEYACRAGSDEELPNVQEYYWPAPSLPTHPVAGRKANAWGLYDLYGYPLEWVFDWYGRYPGGEVTDYAGPATVNDRNIIRAHHETRGQNSSRNRWSTTGATQGDWVGFRVALAIPPQPTSPAPLVPPGKKK
jgi:formylglycine-generating enzyme required for sulfatase activity